MYAKCPLKFAASGTCECEKKYCAWYDPISETCCVFSATHYVDQMACSLPTIAKNIKAIKTELEDSERDDVPAVFELGRSETPRTGKGPGL